jgi:hypothetical protein
MGDGLFQRHRRPVYIRIEPRQPLPDLGRAPGWPFPLQPDDQRLDLQGQLVGVPVGAARAVGEPFNAAAAIALQDFVAGLILREIENSSHSPDIDSPSRSRAMNFTRSSMT